MTVFDYLLSRECPPYFHPTPFFLRCSSLGSIPCRFPAWDRQRDAVEVVTQSFKEKVEARWVGHMDEETGARWQYSAFLSPRHNGANRPTFVAYPP